MPQNKTYMHIKLRSSLFVYVKKLCIQAFHSCISIPKFQRGILSNSSALTSYSIRNVKHFYIALLFTPMLVLGSTVPIEKEKDTLTTPATVSVSELSTNQFVQLPELDKKFPIQDLANKITLPEFTFTTIKSEFPSFSEDVEKAKNEANAGFREIDSTGRWIGSFRNEDIQVLPVGISHEVNGITYQLGFVKAEFNTEYTELTVFVKVIIPQPDDKGKPTELLFGANNVKLSHQGGIIGDANLVLLGDVFIPFNGGNWLLILKGGLNYRTGDTQNKTFVTIDCDGVKEMGIEGEVQFSRNMILPVDPNGKPLPETITYNGAVKEPVQIPNRVTGTFSAIASDWNDLIVEINLSPFVLASQPDKFMFSANQAVFDFSDFRTENVNFPQHYYDKGYLLPNANTWRGVYVQSLEIGMPDEFKTKESIPTKRKISFKAANLLIDNYGVSGYFTAEDIIPLNSGRTSESKAWAYSVDKIGIELASNRLIGADFEGRILLPISDKENTNTQAGADGKMGLGYAGIISEDEYGLVVSTLDTLSFDVFKAKAELLPNSAVELMVVDGNFRPKAVLNGRMAISASQKESLANEGQTYTTGEGDEEKKHTIQFKGIEFQNLVLQTVSPVIQVDYFGYRDEVKIANFPVSIADIAFRANEQEVGIEFDLMINLMGKESKGFAATTRLGVFGKLHEENYKQRWKYDRLTISKIFIEAKIGKVGFSGEVNIFEDDIIYNDGFTGKLSLDIFDTEGLIEAKGLFGNKDGYRYFYVDFIGVLPTTVPIIPPIGMSAIGGGLSYNMERVAHTFTDTSQENMASEDLGLSLSGILYEPNNEVGLDLRAMAFLTMQGTQAFRGKIMLSMLFNKHGGLNRIGLDGYGEFMTSASIGANVTLKFDLTALKEALGMPKFLNKLAPNEVEVELIDLKKEFAKSSIKGDLSISYDFNNETLHGESNIYISVIDGLIRGRGPEGRAGWAVFHFAPSEWYIHIGTPTDRLGLKMGIGSFNLETGGYFMIGDRIPGSPPPPPEVAEILGVDIEKLDYMRDENALGEGKGFAFGADFKVDTGDMNFLILYARFQAGVGFDIMVKNYGEARCINTGKPVGINGWYANGQAYAYLQGELGINIKLFFIRKKIPIIKGGAAILMQAKGPNPYWFRGYAGGYYELLGGLVKGSYRFKVSIGEECELDNASPLGGVKMITDLTPKDGDSNIDVFAAPQAAFAMRINQPIIIPEDEGDKTYKVILEKFNIVDGTGKEIKGSLEWGQMNDRATFISDDILPPDTKLKVAVEVSFQEKINGVFRTILVDGKKAIEQEERNFTTGGAPDHIPLHNIEYSYPVVDQKLFYPGEYGTGYIQLQRGQDYLFDTTQWKSIVNYINESDEILESEFGYNTGDNRVSYVLPKISKEKKYIMSIVSSPKNSRSSSKENTTTKKTDFGNDNTVEIKKNKAETVLKEGEIERLSYEFTSSTYKTFANKVNTISITNYDVGKVYSDVIYLTTRVKKYEGFDLVELRGNSYSDNQPLVSVEASLTDAYYQKDMQPILYKQYPVANRYSFNRDTNIYGVVPKKALPIMSNYIKSLETDTKTPWRSTRFPYRYILAEVYKYDFDGVLRQMYNDYTSGILQKGDTTLNFLNHTYTFMRQGKYQMKLQYILPGGIQGTSANYNFKNPISL